MLVQRTIRRTSTRLVAWTMPLACSGCGMLGEIFYTRGLRLVVLVVVVLAVIGFIVSKSERR